MLIEYFPVCGLEEKGMKRIVCWILIIAMLLSLMTSVIIALLA